MIGITILGGVSMLDEIDQEDVDVRRYYCYGFLRYYSKR